MRQLIDREEVLKLLARNYRYGEGREEFKILVKALPTHKAEEEEWLKTTDIEPEDKEWYLVECCGNCYKWIVQWCAEQKAFLKIDSTGVTGRVFSAAGVRYRSLPQPPEVEK